MLSESGHTALSTANAVHQANAALQQASEAMAPLDLRGISFSWRMLHLGQGLYAPVDGAGYHVHEQLHVESIVSGQFRFENDLGPLVLNPGQSLFVAPHQRHCWECTRPGFMLGGLINVTGAAHREFLETIQEQQGGMSVVNPATCMTWQRELLRLLTAPGQITWRVPAISSVLKLLMIDSIDAMVDLAPWHPNVTVGEEAGDARARDLCLHALEFIEANYGQPIQLRDVALQIGISPRHLNRLFGRIMGESIGSALQRVRLERARKHLREHPGDLVKTVAYSCGFNSPAYFTACYRKAFGSLPAEDRYLGT